MRAMSRSTASWKTCTANSAIPNCVRVANHPERRVKNCTADSAIPNRVRVALTTHRVASSMPMLISQSFTH